MSEPWTILYASGASLQITVELEEERYDNEPIDYEALYDSLYVYNEKHGYPEIAVPGFPIRFDKQEWLFPDGIIYVLPPNTFLARDGFSQYRTFSLEDSIRSRVIIFEEVL